MRARRQSRLHQRGRRERSAPALDRRHRAPGERHRAAAAGGRHDQRRDELAARDARRGRRARRCSAAAGNDVPSAAASGAGGGLIDVSSSTSTVTPRPTINSIISSGSQAHRLRRDHLRRVREQRLGELLERRRRLRLGRRRATRRRPRTTPSPRGSRAPRSSRPSATCSSSPRASSRPRWNPSVGGGGFFAGSHAHATANSQHHNLVDIQGRLTASRTLLAEARNGFSGSLYASGSAAGFASDSSANNSGEAMTIGCSCDYASDKTSVSGWVTAPTRVPVGPGRRLAHDQRGQRRRDLGPSQLPGHSCHRGRRERQRPGAQRVRRGRRRHHRTGEDLHLAPSRRDADG